MTLVFLSDLMGSLVVVSVIFFLLFLLCRKIVAAYVWTRCSKHRQLADVRKLAVIARKLSATQTMNASNQDLDPAALIRINARIVWAMLSGGTAYEPELSVKAG